MRETLTLPAVGVGVSDAFARLDEDASWYLVASKDVIPYFVRALTGREMALKLHLGFGGGVYHRELLGGAELLFPGRWSAMAEVSGGAINVGGRFYVGGLCATVGWMDLDHLGAGLCYTASLR